MPRILQWSDVEPGDADELRQFRCARPLTLPEGVVVYRRDRRRMGAYWEREVEAGIHRDFAKAAKGLPETDIGLIGRGANGIAAVGWAFQYSKDEWWVLAVAVDLDVRDDPDTHCGDELLDELLNSIAKRAVDDDLSEVSVKARIHAKNGDSKKLFGRNQFEFTGETEEEDLEWWEHKMDLTP